jgi:hypothetical protein
MTEREVVIFVEERALQDTKTVFADGTWDTVDFRTLESCYQKGFLLWAGDKLVLSDLGKRSFGVHNERHH